MLSTCSTPGLQSCLLDCICWDFSCSLERHKELAQTWGAWTSRGAQLPWDPIPWCCGAQPQPMSCLASGCPIVLLLLWIIFIYLYGECNKTPPGNGGDSLPFHASQPWAGANKEAHCAIQPCLPEPSHMWGQGVKKGLLCVCACTRVLGWQWWLGGMGSPGEEAAFRGQAGPGMKGLLCWLGTSSGSPTWLLPAQRASSAHPCLPGNRAGHCRSAGGQTVTPWLGLASL